MTSNDVETVIKIVDLVSKVFPGAAVAAFTLYFAGRRIFHKIAISYALRVEGYSASRIDDIVLINKKDRVEIIKELRIVIDRRFRHTLVRPRHPVILKPFESIVMNSKPATEYLVGNVAVDLVDLVRKGKCYFEVVTPFKTIHVPIRRRQKAKQKKLRPTKELELITALTETYNGHVINRDVRFAVLYNENKEAKTAFIHKGGFIEGDWDFKFNALDQSSLVSKEHVRQALEAGGFSKYVGNFSVDDLNESFWK